MSVRVLYSELQKTSVARGLQCSRCQRGCRQTAMRLPPSLGKDSAMLQRRTLSNSITDVPEKEVAGGRDGGFLIVEHLKNRLGMAGRMTDTEQEWGEKRERKAKRSSDEVSLGV